MELEESFEVLRVPEELVRSFRAVANGEMRGSLTVDAECDTKASITWHLGTQILKTSAPVLPMSRVIQPGKLVSTGVGISGNVTRTILVNNGADPTPTPSLPPPGESAATFGYLPEFSPAEVAEVDSLLSEILLRDRPSYEHVMEELVDAEDWMAPWVAQPDAGGIGTDNFTLRYENGQLADGYTTHRGGLSVSLAKSLEMHRAGALSSLEATSLVPPHGAMSHGATADDVEEEDEGRQQAASYNIDAFEGVTAEDLAALAETYVGTMDESGYDFATLGLGESGMSSFGFNGVARAAQEEPSQNDTQPGASMSPAPFAIPKVAAGFVGAGALLAPAPPVFTTVLLKSSLPAPHIDNPALVAARGDVERLRISLDKALPAMRPRLAHMLAAAEAKLNRIDTLE